MEKTVCLFFVPDNQSIKPNPFLLNLCMDMCKKKIPDEVGKNKLEIKKNKKLAVKRRKILVFFIKKENKKKNDAADESAYQRGK